MAYNYEYPYVSMDDYNNDWLINKVKELASEWKNVKHDWETQEEAFESLKTFINNYFDNLDVEEEINNKIDSMIEDGTLEDILLPLVSGYSAPYLVDNVQEMTDKRRLYVLTSDMHIWQWNGTSFTDTGISYADGIGNVLMYKGDIPENADLNNILSTGMYSYGFSSKIENAPTGIRTGYIISISPDNSTLNWNYQIIFDSTTIKSDIWVRLYNGRWYEWTLLSSSKEMTVIEDVGRGVDLDTLNNNSIYIYGVGYNLVNSPSGLVYGIILNVVYNNIPNVQIIFDSTGNIWYRRHTGSVFTEWKLMSDTYVENTQEAQASNYKSISTRPVIGDTIRVMTYNVAHYNNDIGSYGFPSEILHEKVRNLKKMLIRANCDIVCIQEYVQMLDKEGSVSALENLYSPLYPYVFTFGSPAIYTRSELSDTGEVAPPIAMNRPYILGTLNFKNRSILIANAHMSPNASPEDYKTELTQIMNGIQSREKADGFILCGDFNTDADNRTDFLSVTNGNNLANGGYLDWIITTIGGFSVDNIICSSNIIVTSIEVYNDMENLLYSDHFPLVIEAVITDK